MSSAWRTTRVNSFTPSLVWLLAWFEPWLPVPMPTSDTWMPDLPRVTRSLADFGSAFRGNREDGEAIAEGTAARAVVAAVAWARNSRRFTGGIIIRWPPGEKGSRWAGWELPGPILTCASI